DEADWVANHPNGTDLLAVVNGMTKIDGAVIDAVCPRLVVLDGTTGRRKAELEPDPNLYGCVNHPVLLGNRIVMASNGRGNGVPALLSIDLTTLQKDGYLDSVNAAIPYFATSEVDRRVVSKVVVEGSAGWVFGKLGPDGRRIVKFDAITGAVLPFPAPALPFSVGDETKVHYAVNDGSVMVHVAETGPTGEMVDTFRVFDAVSASPVDWRGNVQGWYGNQAVEWVAPWGSDFLLVGRMKPVEGQKYTHSVVVDRTGRVAASQMPFTAAYTDPFPLQVFRFDSLDRTFVAGRGTKFLYGAFHTGPVLVTDKDGAPVEMSFGRELDDRSVSGFGVVGKWLYLASASDVNGYDGSWVDRYHLGTGTRDSEWRLEYPGQYIWDVRGDAEHLALSLWDARSELTSLAIFGAESRARTAVVESWSDGRALGLGEGVVSDGHLFVVGGGFGEGDVPPLLRVNLATGAVTEAEIIAGTGASGTPTVHDGKVYSIWNGAVHVFDAATLRHVGEVEIPYPSSVAFVDGRMIVGAANATEVDARTLQVIGSWGPAEMSLARLVGTSDGIVSGLWTPQPISPSVVASGVVRLTPGGSLVTVVNHSRLRPPAGEDLPEPAPSVRPAPDATSSPSAGTDLVNPAFIPQAISAGAGAPVSADRVSVLSVTAGDRAATVRFRPVADGRHTVRSVDGRKSCSTTSDTCTVKGLVAGTAYRFVVVPDSDVTRASDQSIEVRPWITMKKGSSRKATALLKVPGKGKVSWRTKGKACAVKGGVVAARVKGNCTLTVSVATKSGTVRSVLLVRVA
ncbi:MAG: hypothetical protein RJB57_1411, partial [Actinomycetota bacterium]